MNWSSKLVIRRFTKQIGVVNHGEFNAAIDFRRVKHDVELGCRAAEDRA